MMVLFALGGFAAAAHQGEEFVIILPAIMLVGAFFIMRWANKSDKDDEDGDPDSDELCEAEQREAEPAEPVTFGSRER